MKRLIDVFAPVKEQYGLRDGDRVLVITPSSADAFISFVVLALNHLTVAVADPNLRRYHRAICAVCASFDGTRNYDG